MNGIDLATARVAAGLSQTDLATLSGVAQPNIAAYESGARKLTELMCGRLMLFLQPRPAAALARHRDQILAAAEQHHANNVRVFGSVARGEDRPGSDIDLLVDFEPTASVFDLIELSYAVEELTGIKTDVVSSAGLREGPNRIREEAVAL